LSCFSPTHHYTNEAQLLRHYLSNYTCNSRESFVYPCPFYVPISFPQYFSTTVAPNGNLDSKMMNDSRVESLPIITHLQTTKQQYTINLLASAFKEIDLDILPEFGLDKTDLVECSNKLYQLQDLYEGNL